MFMRGVVHIQINELLLIYITYKYITNIRKNIAHQQEYKNIGIAYNEKFNEN